MESDRPERDAVLPPDEAARLDWRGLRRLRERVELAAREIERLREENAALARRVAALQAEGRSEGDGAAPDALLPVLASGEDRDALRARVESFIAALDRVLAEGEDADRAPEP